MMFLSAFERKYAVRVRVHIYVSRSSDLWGSRQWHRRQLDIYDSADSFCILQSNVNLLSFDSLRHGFKKLLPIFDPIPPNIDYSISE
mmetsp:Transcript_11266/g.25634  ORF Transcript_11266/g.25634 Transcript_11266/m.25634 type:complete len:87 (-) Transcript_11266:1099-1359(-)